LPLTPESVQLETMSTDIANLLRCVKNVETPGDSGS
jgi:hypothetical protein